jgi:hypothetical protein
MADKHADVAAGEAPAPAPASAPAEEGRSRSHSPSDSGPSFDHATEAHINRVLMEIAKLPESLINSLREAIPAREQDKEEIRAEAKAEAMDPAAPPEPGAQPGTEKGKNKKPLGHRFMGW